MQKGFIESFNSKFRDDCLNEHSLMSRSWAGQELRNGRLLPDWHNGSLPAAGSPNDPSVQ